MICEIMLIAVGFALGWALHSARSGTKADNLHPERRILSAVFDKHLLEDLYIVFNNLSLGMRKNTVSHRIIISVLLAISKMSKSIEQGVESLKTHHRNLFIPSQDTILRRLHRLPVEQIESELCHLMAVFFQQAKERGSLPKKLIVAVDVSEKEYYGKMSSKHNHTFKKGHRFVNRSHRYVHHRSGKKVIKMFTAVIANGSISGLTLWATMVKAGESLDELLKRFLDFYKGIMKIDVILMDRGFFSKDVIRVLKNAGVRYLMPARKTKAIKKLICDAVELPSIIVGLNEIIGEIQKNVNRSGHGRSYHNVDAARVILNGIISGLNNAVTIGDVVNALMGIDNVPGVIALQSSLKNLKGACTAIVNKLKSLPEHVLLEGYKIGGKTAGEPLLIDMHLNNERYRMAMEPSRARRAEQPVGAEAAIRRWIIDCYYVYASPVKNRVIAIRQNTIYRRRWSVETSYRMIYGVLMKTTSNDISVRMTQLAIALAIYNLWVMNRSSKRGSNSYDITLEQYQAKFNSSGLLMAELELGLIKLEFAGWLLRDWAELTELSEFAEHDECRYDGGFLSTVSKGPPWSLRGHLPVERVPVYIIA